jgi:Dolichyl-phosphate-mannose-protein mannosyltransferase
VALLWPARIAGPLDGLPLDGVAEAILLGVVFPSLLWFHPGFLRTRLARGIVVALLLWKAFASSTLVPDGWCVRFEPGRPLVSDATSVVPHSWDVRADWLADQPACSAVMRRPYTGLGEFPVWFFNLPAANGMYPVEGDRPPTARTAMTVTGFVDAPRAGELRMEFGDDMRDTTMIYVDGEPVGGAARLEPGIHRIRVDSLLVGDSWRFIPLWNGADLWSSSLKATLKRPSRLDRLMRPAGGWLVTFLVSVWMIAWIASFLLRVRSPVVLAWMVTSSAFLGALAATDHVDAARWWVVALAGAALLPVPTRLRNLSGAVALIGIPWLTLIAVSGAGDIGRFFLYTVGDDYWTFQRNAYRIVLQGYWLEGGSTTFWFQPLYRWIAGVIHLVFGDSSVGERYWDGACLLATALFAWRVTDAYTGFRAGLIAAALTLGVLALGTPWDLVGRGLGEISSAGFLCLAAYVAMRSRRGAWSIAAAAGVLATLAFYGRLNNLPMALGVAVFALPAREPVRRVFRAWPWRLPVAWRTALTVPLVLAVGLVLFAWRTWHYTGVFSVFYGTQRELLAIWQPGVSAGQALMRGLASAMMVLTLNDPAQFDWRALPVLAGAFAAVLAVLGVPRFRDLPAAPTFFLLAGISAAFVARGSAYAGRFSVHIIGVTCALVVCAAASLARPRHAAEK